MVAEEKDSQGDQELGERRMRIQEDFAMYIVARLADKMHFVENDLRWMAKVPEANRRSDPDQRHDNKRIDAEPWNRIERPGGGRCGHEAGAHAAQLQAAEPLPQMYFRLLFFPLASFYRFARIRVRESGGDREGEEVDQRRHHRKAVARVHEDGRFERVQNVSEIEQTRQRQQHEDADHRRVFDRERYRENHRRAEVTLMHPRREHEEPEQRNERDEE